MYVERVGGPHIHTYDTHIRGLKTNFYIHTYLRQPNSEASRAPLHHAPRGGGGGKGGGGSRGGGGVGIRRGVARGQKADLNREVNSPPLL